MISRARVLANQQRTRQRIHAPQGEANFFLHLGILGRASVLLLQIHNARTDPQHRAGEDGEAGGEQQPAKEGTHEGRKKMFSGSGLKTKHQIPVTQN